VTLTASPVSGGLLATIDFSVSDSCRSDVTNFADGHRKG
jgi:hypothetical protein